MTDQPAQHRYSTVAIILHWLIALAIIGMIALGWIMGDMPDGGDKFALFQLHKSIGITILTLSIARVIWRLMNPPPAEPPMPGWQAGLAKFVHIGLYILIIVMPLSGWIMVSASPSGVGTTLYRTLPWPHLPGLADLAPATKEQLKGPLEFVHSKLAWVIIVLLGLHVAGALKHQFVDKDHLLARMLPGFFGRTDGPPQKGRGGLIAFGAAAAFLVVGGVIGAGFISTGTAEPQKTAGGPAKSAAPAWDVDPAKSSIAFKSAYKGRGFTGKFDNWTATIQFDPDKPQDARIRVVVKTASASTGEPYFDDSLKEGDWFNTAKSPEAVFEVNEGVFKDGPTKYEATGILTLRGVRYPLRLPFTLQIDGKTAKMHAEIAMQRIALGIGAQTAADEAGAKKAGKDEWVDDGVGLVVDVVATRK